MARVLSIADGNTENIELYKQELREGWICVRNLDRGFGDTLICLNIRSVSIYNLTALEPTHSYISDLMCKYSLCSYYGKSIDLYIMACVMLI